MELQDYYKHANQWKMDKEALERQQEIQRQEDLKHAWDNAREEMCKAFPIEGVKLYKTEVGQTDSFPFTGGNYHFYVVFPGVEFTPVYDEMRDPRGVIRVVVNCFATYLFKVTHYYVLVDGASQRFDNPYEAFLACCNEMDYGPTTGM